jgi:hypothetical protein
VMQRPFNSEEEEEIEQLEDTEDTKDTETEEFTVSKKYVKIGSLVLVLALILAVIATCAATSGGSESSEVEEEIDKQEESTNHYLVTMAQLKAVPIQTFNPQTPMIANTLGELLSQLPPKGWQTLTSQTPDNEGLQVIYKKEESEYKVWVNTYSDNTTGRQELLTNLNVLNNSTKSIVSESSNIAGGGFIVNNGQTITYWFYYEPNIVVRVSSEVSKGATLTKIKEWAHRVNHSIYAIQD